MNFIARLEFELAHYNVVVQYINYYASKTPLKPHHQVYGYMYLIIVFMSIVFIQGREEPAEGPWQKGKVVQFFLLSIKTRWKMLHWVFHIVMFSERA